MIAEFRGLLIYNAYLVVVFNVHWHLNSEFKLCFICFFKTVAHLISMLFLISGFIYRLNKKNILNDKTLKLCLFSGWLCISISQKCITIIPFSMLNSCMLVAQQQTT